MEAGTVQSDSPAEPIDLQTIEFFGGVYRALHSDSPEILAAGPAGTGKTLAWLARCYQVCTQYPGARVLLVRKTRSSLTDSVLVTFERDILGPDHAMFRRSRVARLNRSSYQFANGSEIVLGGMDRPDKVLSSEYDLIYVPEATDLEITDWETLSGRLRSAKVPVQQLVGDCNPTSPSHWLYQRCQAGLTQLVNTTHRDNPAYWDRERGDWTDRGRQYLDRLGRLTGPRRARFLEGLWVQAEGLVFDGWDAGYHLIEPFEIPYSWPLYLSIDFGVANPFVCQFVREDPDGRLFLQREIYHTNRLVEDHAASIKEQLRTLPAPSLVVCDHDLSDRLTLERHAGISTVAADKKDVAGVQEVCERLKPGHDGQPRLAIFRGARCHAEDAELASRGKPTNTADEIPGYVWDTAAKVGERPLKRNDHGCDALRYLCRYLAIWGRGQAPATGTPKQSLLGYDPRKRSY